VQDVEVAAIKRLLAGELDVEPDRLSHADATTPRLGRGVGVEQSSQREP
jgi:hypothetical protein